jgi:hypothetical protein
MCVYAAVGGDQVEDVTTVPGGPVRPEARFLAIKDHLKAVARAAQHVTYEENAPTLLAGGE